MQPFRDIEGIAAPYLRSDVDTDALCPSRFRLKELSKYGFERALFAALRFDESGAEKPDFILNQQPYREATILVGGKNFGCGSSRETAVWALRDFGFRAVIATSFASIFETNCIRNGLLPLPLEPDAHAQFIKDTFVDGQTPRVAIDLPAGRVRSTLGTTFEFTIDPRAKQQLLSGLDSIGETLLMSADIHKFRERDRRTRPWIYSQGRA